MKILSEKQISLLSYQARCQYYADFKKFKFGDLKEGVPMVYYSNSGKLIIFEYRISGTYDDYYLIYGKNSCHGFLPTEVEIASKEDIDVYIQQLTKSFNKTLKYYNNLKEFACGD